jgi:hypothetical protein
MFGQLVQYGKEISLLQYAHFPFTYLLFYDCGKQESGRATFIVGVRIRRANELLELSETGAVGDMMKLVCLEDFYFMLMAGVLRVYLFRMILLCN